MSQEDQRVASWEGEKRKKRAGGGGGSERESWERWEDSDLARPEKLDGSEVARWEEWKSSEVARWEVPGYADCFG